jgi:hypothetical protein
VQTPSIVTATSLVDDEVLMVPNYENEDRPQKNGRCRPSMAS